MSSWYDANWQYRVGIAFDSTKIAGTTTLTDFPVLITAAGFTDHFWDNVESDGSDIVVTANDGVTKLKRELVSIDTSGQTPSMELWVKKDMDPNITHYDNGIWLYFGNAAAGETNDPETWNSSFQIVQHLNEDPSGGSPQALDSTSKGHDGTSSGGMTSDDLVEGQISTAWDFDGTDDYCDFPNSDFDFAESEPFTISFWFCPGKDISSGINEWMLAHNNATEGKGFFIGWHGSDYGEICFGTHNGRIETTTSSWDQGTWYYLTFEHREEDSDFFFINNTQDGSEGDSGYAGPPTSETLRAAWRSDDGGDTFEGALDEIRVLDTILSGDWKTTEYQNQSSPETFYRVGVNLDPDPEDWSNKIGVLVDHTKVEGSSPLYDFPVLVTGAGLTSTFWNNMASDGSDVRVYNHDETTQIPCDLVYIDTTSERMELWVKKDVYPEDDVGFWIYFNNPNAWEKSDPNTWDDDFVAVWHMEEDPTGDAPQILDSTAGETSFDGTCKAYFVSSDQVDGICGGHALDFRDGPYVVIGTDPGLRVSQDRSWSMSCWVYPDEARFQSIMGYLTFDAGQDPQTGISQTTSDIARGWMRHDEEGDPATAETSITMVASTWHLLGVTRSYNRIDIIMDGVEYTGDPTDLTINVWAGTEDFLLGNNYGGANPHDYELDGKLDECRVSKIDRSAGWYKTSYNNQSSPETFYSFTEDVPTDPGVTVEYDYTAETATVRLYTGLSELPSKLTETSTIRIFTGTLPKGENLETATIRLLPKSILILEGWWVDIIDSKMESAHWLPIDFEANIPAETVFGIRARSASTEEGLTEASWGGYVQESGADLNVDDGRFLEVQVHFLRPRIDVDSPELDWFRVCWEERYKSIYEE